MSIKIQYNKQLLEKLCLRDECIVDFTTIEKYNRNIKVNFICKCGNTHNKTFRVINYFGGFCKICTNNNKLNKFKETCIEKYGKENPFQSQEIQNKIRQTCIERYNTEHPMQNPEIQNKIKQTCIEKYGKENPFQSQEIQNKIKQTCIEKYGKENPSQSQEIKDKKIETCIKNFGVENPFQSQEIKNKIKQTCIERYNTENPMQNPEIKNKIRQTCIERYNTEHPMQNTEIKDKIKQTFIENFGVENPSQSQEIKDKKIETYFKKTGYENPMQNPEIFEKALKNSYNIKEFTFPCSNIIQVQGYEPFLLDILVKEGYIFEDIIVKRTSVPEIWYEKNNKKSRYFCDIYIPKTNTIYEVKSNWTYKNNIEVNLLKKQACIDAGYNFELWIFDAKGNRINEVIL